MEGIKIRRRPVLKDPYLICAWPGMGEVAFKVATYLAEKLKCQEFAQLKPQEFFYLTGSAVQEGVLNIPELPYGKFYYWKNTLKTTVKAARNDLIIFISNAQPDLAKAEEYARRIIEVAKIFKVKSVINFAAMPQPMDHTHPANVWYAGTSAQVNNNLKNYNLSLLKEGQISGMNGLFLGLAKKEGLDGFCLLGEIPLYTIQIENPKASLAVLGALSKILNIQIDLNDLAGQARVMEEEINRLLDYLKIDVGSVGPIGEDEIEKIKKTLSQLTKLPGSVKEKIEKLFSLAKDDISRANELKSELDKWNVYKDYEDRFLDLFKTKNN